MNPAALSTCPSSVQQPSLNDTQTPRTRGSTWADAFSLGTEVAHLFPCALSGLVPEPASPFAAGPSDTELAFQNERYDLAMQQLYNAFYPWVPPSPGFETTCPMRGRGPSV